MKSLGAWVLLFLMSAATGFSAVTITILESGSDVVGTASGTANLTGLTGPITTQSGTAFLWPSSPIARFGGLGTINWDLYTGASGPASFGTGGSGISADSGSGPRVGVFSSTAIILPDDYVSGSAISATSTWLGESFVSLGITPGTYTWTWSSDSLTITAIPEPSVYVGVMGLAALAFVIWRRRPRMVVSPVSS